MKRPRVIRASPAFASWAALQRLQFGLDGGEPFHRVGHVDREIGQDR